MTITMTIMMTITMKSQFEIEDDEGTVGKGEKTWHYIQHEERAPLNKITMGKEICTTNRRANIEYGEMRKLESPKHIKMMNVRGPAENQCHISLLNREGKTLKQMSQNEAES